MSLVLKMQGVIFADSVSIDFRGLGGFLRGAEVVEERREGGGKRRTDHKLR